MLIPYAEKSCFFLITLFFSFSAQNQEKLRVIVGAERMEIYLPLIKNKRIAIVANHTSLVGNQHLVDILLSEGIQITKIFTPEHGFSGEVDAGEKIVHQSNEKIKLPIISLYGKNKKPTLKQLKSVEAIVFDIQDVGIRFYTYISTMHYVMEACAEQNISFLVLDRPNPNSFYIDGPVLDMNLQSFVGMHPIPIVYGLTIGELAKMINGEKWLKDNLQVNLTVIPCVNYTHFSRYKLSINPSPNLPNNRAIYLYPSLCLFEGTTLSIGRGTKKPFQVIGAPKYTNYTFSFTPKSIPGAKYPKYQDEICWGKDLSKEGEHSPSFSIKELIEFYIHSTDKVHFFNALFDRLAGTTSLKKQIKQGLSEEVIRMSWKHKLEAYKKIRKKYLLYVDFE